MNRCAIYARYSTDKQDSTADQVRKCREYAEHRGWTAPEDQVYADEGLSGAGADRREFQRLLENALAVPRPFDVILVDDTSRLSRDLPDAVRTLHNLRFQGVRLVAVSQNIDSDDEQADVLMTVHGLVDSLYVKELAKKTHRGLEGRMLRGLHAGGRCFGYRNVKVSAGENGDQGVRQEVDRKEAETVRRIFGFYAEGLSLARIAKTLNEERIAPPRPRKGKAQATWCPTAIREMLRRELYAGRVIWNRSRFVKVPGTNRRVSRPRPRSEWRILERPELRIVDAELWERVQQRLAEIADRYGDAARPSNAGLRFGRSTSPYLWSGILKCAVCGANLAIVTGHKSRNARYGCPEYLRRGACTNHVTERRDVLEAQLWKQLQEAVLTPEAIEYVIGEFGRQLRERLTRMSSGLEDERREIAKLERERENLVRALADGYSPALTARLGTVEQELAARTSCLLSTEPGSIEAELSKIRAFVNRRLADLTALLQTNVPRARAELQRSVGSIRMVPHDTRDERWYEAEGAFNLLAAYPENGTGPTPGRVLTLDGCGGWI